MVYEAFQSQGIIKYFRGIIMTREIKLTNTPFYTNLKNDKVFREGQLYYAKNYVSIDRTHCEITHYLIKIIKVNKVTVKARIVGKYISNQDSWKHVNKYDCTLYDWSDAKDITLKLYDDPRYIKGYMTAKYNKILFTPLRAYIRPWYEYNEFNA